ncbi:hypothetical protein SCLARK_001313 [Spiroplasma clarkii]|uniref:hypothetical protein n=1 Tax=Spiroplasma clarkii TaxID=2139 RepID=UPI000B573D60|nr:hypothetical protein [Spiroplasma clarkii]ARU91849.1 hypothetical protein SCLARK_001313 [Spiroplasma clarkii]
MQTYQENVFKQLKEIEEVNIQGFDQASTLIQECIANQGIIYILVVVILGC